MATFVILKDRPGNRVRQALRPHVTSGSWVHRMVIGQDSLTSCLPLQGSEFTRGPMISGRDGHSDPVACVNSLSLRVIRLGSAAAAPCSRRRHVDAAEPQDDVQCLRKSWTRCHFLTSISVALERSNHAGLCEVQAIVPRKHAVHTLVHCSRNEGLGQTVEIAIRPARAIDGNCRLDLAAVRFLCLENVGYTISNARRGALYA